MANCIITTMNKLTQSELTELLTSYGSEGLLSKTSKLVTPDSAIYIFTDSKGAHYILFVADYLGDYMNLAPPFNLEFDDGAPYSKVSFRVTKIISYRDDAKKKANGYTDDKHYLTKTNDGDVCMLFVVDNLKIE